MRRAAFHLMQQRPDDAGRGGALDPLRLACDQRGAIRVQKCGRQRQRQCRVDDATIRRYEDARHEATHLPCCRCECRFIEVVQVKVRQAVFTAKRAEVFQMQIAGTPHMWRIRKSHGPIREPGPGEMRRSAKESE